ncbi:adenylate kinase [bacterium]|nr:adenylate kinase [bacterium]
MRFIFLGPPGAGKGTQAKGEAEGRGLLYIATGDQLRAAVKAGTEMGIEAKKCMDSGQLVPDDVIIGIVRDLLGAGADSQGVVFDGFPRTLPQAEALDALLAEREEALDSVIYIDVPDEAIVGRLSGRRVCRGCGATYHIDHLQPETEGVCDPCGGELYQRDDDKPETVLNRLQVYKDQTADLLGYYEKQGLLVRIDGDQSIEEVGQAVRAAMASAG